MDNSQWKGTIALKKEDEEFFPGTRVRSSEGLSDRERESGYVDDWVGSGEPGEWTGWVVENNGN